jgi:hypothetical protein
VVGRAPGRGHPGQPASSHDRGVGQHGNRRHSSHGRRPGRGHPSAAAARHRGRGRGPNPGPDVRRPGRNPGHGAGKRAVPVLVLPEAGRPAPGGTAGSATPLRGRSAGHGHPGSDGAAARRSLARCRTQQRIAHSPVRDHGREPVGTPPSQGTGPARHAGGPQDGNHGQRSTGPRGVASARSRRRLARCTTTSWHGRPTPPDRGPCPASPRLPHTSLRPASDVCSRPRGSIDAHPPSGWGTIP